MQNNYVRGYSYETFPEFGNVSKFSIDDDLILPDDFEDNDDDDNFIDDIIINMEDNTINNNESPCKRTIDSIGSNNVISITKLRGKIAIINNNKSDTNEYN